MTQNELQELFIKGTVPHNLDGFYKGKLDLLIPNSFLQSFGGFVSKFYLPWKGKHFYKNRATGNNLIPPFFSFFIKAYFGENKIYGKDKNGIHVFLFKTNVGKGLKDSTDVLKLNYNLPENPTTVRNVVDELVCIEKDKFLGKAYMKKGEKYRLVAFFSLEK